MFKKNRKPVMSSAALSETATRRALSALVEREERRVGSRCVAYHNVAQTVGISASWVSKFLRKTEEVAEPRMTLFQNIRTAYETLCERVESDNRADEHKLRILRGDLDAIDTGIPAQGNSQNKTKLGEG